MINTLITDHIPPIKYFVYHERNYYGYSLPRIVLSCHMHALFPHYIYKTFGYGICYNIGARISAQSSLLDMRGMHLLLHHNFNSWEMSI